MSADKKTKKGTLDVHKLYYEELEPKAKRTRDRLRFEIGSDTLRQLSRRGSRVRMAA
ncbi:hypothetical protein ACSCB1_35290 [Streptomyces europaeiscabiei]|uniref:hypothetical protein n=1 Tax=Streptomyces europaeiscabiei TaxID=146819 RepID=UPI00131C90C3|nr:hypothetical protein [Streptomyces europaeiscabiei]